MTSLLPFDLCARSFTSVQTTILSGANPLISVRTPALLWKSANTLVDFVFSAGPGGEVSRSRTLAGGVASRASYTWSEPILERREENRSVLLNLRLAGKIYDDRGSDDAIPSEPNIGLRIRPIDSRGEAFVRQLPVVGYHTDIEPSLRCFRTGSSSCRWHLWQSIHRASRIPRCRARGP